MSLPRTGTDWRLVAGVALQAVLPPFLRLWRNSSHENVPAAADERGCAGSGRGSAGPDGWDTLFKMQGFIRAGTGARVCACAWGWGLQPGIKHMLVATQSASHMSTIYFRAKSRGIKLWGTLLIFQIKFKVKFALQQFRAWVIWWFKALQLRSDWTLHVKGFSVKFSSYGILFLFLNHVRTCFWCFHPRSICWLRVALH